MLPRATGSRNQALSGLAGPFLHFVSLAWLLSKMRTGLQAALSHINTAPPADSRGVSVVASFAAEIPGRVGRHLEHEASKGHRQIP